MIMILLFFGFLLGTEEHWGTWKLIASGPALVLKSNEDQQQLTFLIYEATATQMRGILSPYKKMKIKRLSSIYVNKIKWNH